MTYNSPKKAFTLIETLVAVLLLVTAITGPLTIASKGLTAALVAKDQITAYFLAQDAIEYIRYRRDTNCLGTSPAACASNVWLSGLGQCLSADGTVRCVIDSTHNIFSSGTNNCSALPTACTNMKYDTVAKRFTYGSVSSTVVNTIFTRTTSIINPYGSSADQALVTVVVEWSDMAGITRNVTMREVLFNWQ